MVPSLQLDKELSRIPAYHWLSTESVAEGCGRRVSLAPDDVLGSDPSMTDYNQSAEKRIDLENVRPVALDGGTAILAQTYRTTNTGVDIDAGEVPVAVSGVYSPTDLRHALAACGFEHEHIQRALRIELRGPNATKAVSVAEKQAGHAEVLSA